MVTGMSYQMDHIWWASSRLKNSPGLLIGSQCSRTLYRSFIVTLYVINSQVYVQNYYSRSLSIVDMNSIQFIFVVSMFCFPNGIHRNLGYNILHFLQIKQNHNEDLKHTHVACTCHAFHLLESRHLCQARNTCLWSKNEILNLNSFSPV